MGLALGYAHTKLLPAPPHLNNIIQVTTGELRRHFTTAVQLHTPAHAVPMLVVVILPFQWAVTASGLSCLSCRAASSFCAVGPTPSAISNAGTLPLVMVMSLVNNPHLPFNTAEESELAVCYVMLGLFWATLIQMPLGELSHPA